MITLLTAAAAVSLVCVQATPRGDAEIIIVPDETTSTVTVTDGPTVERYPAAFGPTELVYRSQYGGEYRINRVDLTFKYRNPNFGTTGGGQCRVEELPETAF